MGQQRSKRIGSGKGCGCPSLAGPRTELPAWQLVSQAGETHELLHKSSVDDRQPSDLPSSLCSQVWPTELSTMTSMLCVTCVSSSTSCPSAARTRLPSESAMTPGGWYWVYHSLAFLGLSVLTGSQVSLEQVVEYVNKVSLSCGEDGDILGQEQLLVISLLL